MGLPSGSALREPLDDFPLRDFSTPEWQAILARHPGR